MGSRKTPPNEKDKRLAEAAGRLWFVIVQREVVGIGNHEPVWRVYDVPAEVRHQMGPRLKRQRGVEAVRPGLAFSVLAEATGAMTASAASMKMISTEAPRRTGLNLPVQSDNRRSEGGIGPQAPYSCFVGQGSKHASGQPDKPDTYRGIGTS